MSALPFALLLLDIWPLRRVDGPATEEDPNRRASVAALLVEKIPLLLLAAGSCIATLIAQHAGGAMASSVRFSLGQHCCWPLVFIRIKTKQINCSAA